MRYNNNISDVTEATRNERCLCLSTVLLFYYFFICCNYTHLVSKYWVNNKSSDSLFSFIFYFYATLLHYASGQS